MEENFPEVKGMSLCIEWDKYSAQWIEKHNYIKWLMFQNYPDFISWRRKWSESLSVVSDSLQPHGLYVVHGILQARLLEWVAIPFSRGSSQPRDQTQVSRIAGRFFTSWTTRQAQIEKKRSF